MTDYIDGYKQYLSEERHASRQHAEVLPARRPSVPGVSPVRRNARSVLQAAASDIEEYMRWMTGQGQIRRHGDALCRIAEVLLSLPRAGRPAEEESVQDVTPLKVKRHLPQILTGREVELFLEQPQCVDARGLPGSRNAGTALRHRDPRQRKLIALDVSDLNLSAGIIHCAGKSKERVIPLYPAAIKALRDYVEEIRPEHDRRAG